MALVVQGQTGNRLCCNKIGDCVTLTLVTNAVMLSAKDAKVLDKQIRSTAFAMQDAANQVVELWDELKSLVAQAKKGEIHVVLGYETWPVYLMNVVDLRPANIAERQQLVFFLTSEGLSTRAIADMLGIGHATVARDQLAIDSDETVEQIVGLNGKEYKRKVKRDKTSQSHREKFMKRYNALSEDISVIVDAVGKEPEYADAAAQVVEHLAELRDSLTVTIRKLRAIAKEQEQAE